MNTSHDAIFTNLMYALWYGLLPWPFLLICKEVFRSILQHSRPDKADLECLFVRAYILPFHLSTKSFFDFNEIWLVGSGR